MRPKLSILITIYQEDVNALVRHLTNHANRCRVVIDVVLGDDHSSEFIQSSNRPLAHLDEVRYIEMPENIGRSALRNRLAEEAEYDNLLFLDGDCMPVNKNFLCNYLPFCSDRMVVYGGTTYHDERPEDPSRVLHWHYGRQREALPVKKRRKHPFRSFHSNNFLMHRNVFNRISFDEGLKHYGHEDGLLAAAFREQAVPVIHVDNPVYHLGIERTEEFLKKHYSAVQNLATLDKQGKRLPNRLMKTYKMLTYLGGNLWIPLFFKCLDKEDFIVNEPQVPSLRKFDALRLYWLHEAMKS